jgi:hypothetical protein
MKSHTISPGSIPSPFGERNFEIPLFAISPSTICAFGNLSLGA